MSSKQVILIIEDQLSIAMFLHASLSEVCDYPILMLKSLAEVEEVLASDFMPIVALCDLTLPDAPKGETVAVLRKHKITTVVLTGRYDNATREKMLGEMVADYVVKDGPAAIQYVVSTVAKLISNDNRVIWILTPGTRYTQKLVALLKVQRYKLRVFETYSNVKDMLLEESPDLLLLEGLESIADSDVIGFIKFIREQYNPNELPMLSCEPSSNILFAIHLMKYGVNDFFNANFTAEELYLRIHQNLEQAAAYKEIQKISQTDGLTGLYNRRYFFEKGEALLELAKSRSVPYFVLMCDIDFFKKVNDTYGHQVGDDAIIFVANAAKKIFSEFLVARFGGEEYCIVGQLDQSAVMQRAEQLRIFIENQSKESTTVHFTLSVGVSVNCNSLDQGIGFADQALYTSKESGRNKVTLHA